jgi:hypothetical protein
MTWPEWLASRGASRDAVKLMTVGGDSTQVSALYVIRQYAMLRTSTQRYKIAGGMDRLPTAMAAGLGDIVRYNAPVVRVERGPSGFRVDYREGPVVRSTIAARIVFAVPAGTLRQIEVRPALSAGQPAGVRSTSSAIRPCVSRFRRSDVSGRPRGSADRREPIARRKHGTRRSICRRR